MDHYYTDSPHNFASSMHHNQFNISHFNSASDNAYNSFLYGDADSSPAPPLQLIMSRQHLPTPPPNIPPTTFSSCPLVEPTPSLHKSSPGLFVNNQPYPDFSFPEPEAMLTTIAPEATYELGFTQSPASITTSFRLNKRGSSSDETLEFDYESSENGNGYPKSRRTMGSGKSTRRKKASRRTGSISSMEDDEKRKLFLERNRQAAYRCRQRKKELLDSLQNQADNLTAENIQLQQTLIGLKDSVIRLGSIITHGVMVDMKA